MQHVGGGAAQRESPIHLIFLWLLFTPPKGRDRGAHRNVHQKAIGIEGPYRDESGGNRGLHDHPHRPAGESAAALRALPAAMPEGAQRASAAGMARSIDAEIAVEAALPPTSSRMSEVRVEAFPWAEPWARVTTALSNAVAKLARELSWQGTARQYGLNWKSVATIVKRAVQYGLKNRSRPPVHVIGIDEVSRRKGQVYLTVVYDLERRVLLWVGDERTEEAVRPFFTKEMGRRRCPTLQVICMDMWAAYANLVKEHAPQAQILFDRFHIVKHLNEAVEEVRRSEMRRLSQKEKVAFKRSRWLLLKNPWNLSDDQKERLSTLVRWNAPIVRAYYLKEAFQMFWDYQQPKRAEDHLEKWMRSAMRSRLEPFKKFVRMLRVHLDGILAWTNHRVSNANYTFGTGADFSRL